MHNKTPLELLDMNKRWAAERLSYDSDFFTSLVNVQKPDYLWIGCSDSRVPANEIVGLKSGEMFVHRNIANVVPHSDLNCLSVIQYAVEALEVSHIIVVGHYGCGGIKAAMDQNHHGEIDNWLAHIKDIYRQNYEEISAISDRERQADRLCELNVSTQVRNVAKTSVVQKAWKNGRKLKVHGWVYGLEDGILHDLDVGVESREQLHTVFQIDTTR
ncbi:MAG: carbonate dehydratase [Hyphomicrobiales bacterium]|nr:carbonate dehydratase [Hyphomicrobiales bacterium]